MPPPKFPCFTASVYLQQQPLPEPPLSLKVTTNYIPDLVRPNPQVHLNPRCMRS